MRLFSYLTVALLAAGAPAMVAAKPAAPPPTEARDDRPPASLTQAARARIELAERRLEMLQLMYTKGMRPLDELLTATRQVFIAYRESYGPPEKLVEAAERHRKAMATLVQLTEQRFKSAVVAEVDLTAARYALAEAEFWLEEAKWQAATKKTH